MRGELREDAAAAPERRQVVKNCEEILLLIRCKFSCEFMKDIFVEEDVLEDESGIRDSGRKVSG